MNIKILLFQIIFFIVKFRGNTKTFYDETSLYKSQTDVIVLHAGNFMEILNYTKGLLIVEYYASWCGHCISFSKIYKQLSRQLRSWGIYFGAINCANSENSRTCEDAGIHLYPTIKIFPCTDGFDNRIPLNLNKLTQSWTVQTIRSVLAQYLINQQKCGTFVHASSELSESFWEDFKKDSTTYDIIILIVGTDNDRGILDSISLDMRICPRIFVSFLPLSSPFISHFGSYHQHALLVVDKNVDIKHVTDDFDDYDGLRKGLYEAVKDHCPESVIFDSVNDNESKIEILKDINIKPSSEIQIKDIISGIGMALREEIPRKPLEKSDFPLIKAFVDAMEECIPWPKPQKDFMTSLKNWISAQNQVIETKDWIALLNSTPAVEAFPYQKTWITCRGVTPNFRQYPCSLWLSFHIGTVNCERNRQNSEISSLDVILAARGFITNFFSCFVCREHFRELTKYVKDRVKSSQEAILFLWDGHNNVNARLRHDDSADPTAPKVQFPPIEMCAACWSVDGLSGDEIYVSNPGYGISPIKWNKLSVLEFMRSHYGPDNIRISEPDTQGRSDLYDSSDEVAKSSHVQMKRR